jgi:hypothetical protein
LEIAVPRGEARLGVEHRDAVEKSLAMEGHVTQGERIIARQREIVAASELSGRGDAGKAKALLALFEETQLLHVDHRDRLRRDLLDGSIRL